MSNGLEDLQYGPVVVRYPDSYTRIGYYDNDKNYRDLGGDVAVIYHCSPPFTISTGYYFVDSSMVFPVDTDALWERREQLDQLLFDGLHRQEKSSVDYEELYEYSLEWSCVDSLLADRLIEARMNEGRVGGRRVVLSHSSLDTRTATSLLVDLANEAIYRGRTGGRSKLASRSPAKSRGIDECD